MRLKVHTNSSQDRYTYIFVVKTAADSQQLGAAAELTRAHLCAVTNTVCSNLKPNEKTGEPSALVNNLQC